LSDKDLSPGKPARRWFFAAVLALTVPAMVVGTLMVRARNACTRGAAAFARGALDEAAIEYERALGFRVPGDPVFRTSIEGMRAVAVGQERAGDLDGAWRTSERLQAAIRETASPFFAADAGRLATLESERQELESRFNASDARARGSSGPARVSSDQLWSVLATLLLGIWTACALVVSARLGRGRPLLRWSAALLAAWVAWLVCLRLA